MLSNAICAFLAVFVIAVMPCFISGVCRDGTQSVLLFGSALLLYANAFVCCRAGPAVRGLSLVFLGVLAGHGALQILCTQKEAAEDGAEHPAVTKSEEGQMRPAWTEAVTETETGRLNVGAKKAETEGREAASGAGSGQAPLPGAPLRNPLPVPKRHVRREMGYAFEPSPERMHYDILPPEDDDFDI